MLPLQNQNEIEKSTKKVITFDRSNEAYFLSVIQILCRILVLLITEIQKNDGKLKGSLFARFPATFLASRRGASVETNVCLCVPACTRV